MCFTPVCTMAVSSESDPPTLFAKYRSGSRIDSPTAMNAAKWITASAVSRASVRASAAVSARFSSRSRPSGTLCAVALWKDCPPPRRRSPASSSRRTVWEPIYPAPPVTRFFVNSQESTPDCSSMAVLCQTEPSCSWRPPHAWESTPIFTLVGDHLNEVLAVAARAGIAHRRHAPRIGRDSRRRRLGAHSPQAGALAGDRRPRPHQFAHRNRHRAPGRQPADRGQRQPRQHHWRTARRFRISTRSAWRGPSSSGPPKPPDAAQIPFYLERAYAEANTGRKGAVHLTIPVDLFTAAARQPAAPSPLPTRAARAIRHVPPISHMPSTCSAPPSARS